MRAGRQGRRTASVFGFPKTYFRGRHRAPSFSRVSCFNPKPSRIANGTANGYCLSGIFDPEDDAEELDPCRNQPIPTRGRTHKSRIVNETYEITIFTVDYIFKECRQRKLPGVNDTGEKRYVARFYVSQTAISGHFLLRNRHPRYMAEKKNKQQFINCQTLTNDKNITWTYSLSALCINIFQLFFFS